MTNNNLMKKHTVPTPYPVGPVHIYEFELNGNTVLFDTGPPTADARRYIEENINIKKLDYLFITHFHPDHYGLIRFIEENSKAIITVSKYDALLYEHREQRIKFLEECFQSLGFTEEAIERMQAIFPVSPKEHSFANHYRILEDSSEILLSLGIEYLSCPGHSQSDIIYLIDHYAVSADVVLREIFQTPLLDFNLHTLEGRFCNYRAYCETIPKLKSIETRTFLPGHRDYINSIDDQILFYVGKMIQRAELLLPHLKSDMTIFEVVLLLFPNALSVNPFFIYIKTSEILFLKDFLSNPGLLVKALQNVGIHANVHSKIEKLEVSFS